MKKSLIALWASISILLCICEPSNGDIMPWALHELACLTSAAIAAYLWNRTEKTSSAREEE